MPLDILVVDDEADIRSLMAGVLEDEGYRPRTAADSDAALAALAERRRAVYGANAVLPWPSCTRTLVDRLSDLIRPVAPSRT